MQYNIGDKVYSIVLGGNHKWMLHETTIDKITITKSGVSYHLKNNSDIGGSYTYYKGNKKPIFKDKTEAEKLLKSLAKEDLLDKVKGLSDDEMIEIYYQDEYLHKQCNSFIKKQDLQWFLDNKDIMAIRIL